MSYNCTMGPGVIYANIFRSIPFNLALKTNIFSSEDKRRLSGVPQGSVLGTYIFGAEYRDNGRNMVPSPPPPTSLPKPLCLDRPAHSLVGA